VAEVSLTLHAGQTIALVGENGSGKTTLAALLCGLRRPDSGRVFWNGTDLSTLDINLLRARIAVITQEHHHWPFTATVNIRLGDTDRDAGPESIERAARRAAAHDMIVELPRGNDTLLDRTFEGGQATTILITHRLANVRHADRIYVMERGRLIADGTHDELMEHADPTYRELFELQAAGYVA
jgi:ATP-binding cassette subfamily B protein